MVKIDRIPGQPTRNRRALAGIGADFVPYSGAIDSVDLGAYNLSAAAGTFTGAVTATSLTDGTYTLTMPGATWTFDGPIRFSGKVSFTQTDDLEYVDSLADGYLDLEATTGLRWRIAATEQVVLTDGKLAPTTDYDVALGDATHRYSALFTVTSTLGVTTIGDGGTTDYVSISATGDLIFVGSQSGLAYGELSCYDENATITISGTGIANKVQVTAFDVAGPSNGTTPSAASDDITILTAGDYLCTVSTTIESTGAGGADEIGLAVYKNNGATLFENLHAHRNLSGGAGDVGSVTLSGIVDLAVNDTIELWIWNEDSTDDIVVDDCTMSLVQIGG